MHVMCACAADAVVDNGVVLGALRCSWDWPVRLGAILDLHFGLSFLLHCICWSHHPSMSNRSNNDSNRIKTYLLGHGVMHLIFCMYMCAQQPPSMPAAPAVRSGPPPPIASRRPTVGSWRPWTVRLWRRRKVVAVVIVAAVVAAAAIASNRPSD